MVISDLTVSSQRSVSRAAASLSPFSDLWLACPPVRLNDLDRVGRGHEDVGEKVVGIKRDRRHQLLEFTRREELLGRFGGRRGRAGRCWRRGFGGGGRRSRLGRPGHARRQQDRCRDDRENTAWPHHGLHCRELSRQHAHSTFSLSAFAPCSGTSAHPPATASLRVILWDQQEWHCPGIYEILFGSSRTGTTQSGPLTAPRWRRRPAQGTLAVARVRRRSVSFTPSRQFALSNSRRRRRSA